VAALARSLRRRRRSLRDCLKKASAVPPKPETSLAKAIRSALDWIVVPAQAASVSRTTGYDWFFTELCFKGANSTQTCTYKACLVDFSGKTTCKTLFVTGA
jgi:hypothetical protein